MPSAPNSRARVASSGRVRVRADPQAAQAVCPGEHRLEVLVQLRGHERHGADEDSPGAAVDRQEVALAQGVRPDRRRARRLVELEVAATGDARLPHPPRHDGGVRRHAAVHGEDSLRRDHPVDVVRGRLEANEQHGTARRTLDGGVGVEHDRAARCAGRRVQPSPRRLERRARIDRRVEELVELRRVDARDRFFPRDQPLVDHRDRRLECGRGRTLRRARLQEIQTVVLDGELDVLDVAVVTLEAVHRLDQLRERIGQGRAHRLDRLRGADAGDDVLALGVSEELAVRAALTGRRVARERNARPRTVALVAEDHLHDVHGGAEVVGDVVGAAVHLGARRVPRREHGGDRPRELYVRVLRELAPRFLAVDPLVGLD